MNKIIQNIKYYLFAFILMGATGCTDLSEELYDGIISDNYYATKEDVIRAYVRPFDHAFWSVKEMYDMQENSGDFMATINREGDWLDGQKYFRQHYHTWTIDDSSVRTCWNANYEGIMQCNVVIDDLNRLDPISFGFTQEEFNGFKAGLRTLRAWFLINVFDFYRNIQLPQSGDPDLNSKEQVSPQEAFDFLEKELKEAIDLLPSKAGNKGNDSKQGQFNKASAATLLVRLYLNAEKWIGVDKYTECATYAQNIIDNKYGFYQIDTRWDAPFDWNNQKSNEVIFAFAGSLNRKHEHYSDAMYKWSMPAYAPLYLGFLDWGSSGGNPKFALQPSRDVDGNLYSFELGMPVAKFQKYPEDYRLKLYKNLATPSTREGMFLFGYLEYKDDKGNTKRVKRPGDSYELYIRDQVGKFLGTPPGTPIADKVSTMDNGDHNSGWYLIKYPFYRSNDPGAIEADYALLRLAEVYYSLAECKFRKGDVTGAAKILNEVRKRYYPATKHTEYLYAPDGAITLTANELLDELGREFIGEGRRRTDLIRWNKFWQGTWWDKKPDADNHTELLPFHRKTLSLNPSLKQNSGYEDISR